MNTAIITRDFSGLEKVEVGTLLTIGKRSKKTDETYNYHIEQYRFFCKANKIKPFSFHSFIAFIEHIRTGTYINPKNGKEGSYSVSKLNNAIAGLKAFFKDNGKHSIIEEIESWQFGQRGNNKQDVKVSKDDLLTEDEYNRLLENCSEKLSLIVQFLRTTGTRIFEACNIKLSHCHKNGKTTIELKKTKRNKERKVYISNELYESIRESFNSGTYLFETRNQKKYNERQIYRDLQIAKRKAGIQKKVYPHLFRHMLATQLASTGRIKAASAYLGDSVAVFMKMYVHDSFDSNDLEEIGLI